MAWTNSSLKSWQWRCSGMGKGGKPGAGASGKNIVVVDSGKKGAWNKSMNKPEPNTVYKVDGNKTFQTDALGRTSSAEGILNSCAE